MTAYAYDSEGWYTGPVADDTPDSTPIEPPILETDATPGAPRSVWSRVAWYVVARPFPPIEPVPPVPDEVTMRQARTALLMAGKLDAVQAVIDGIADETERRVAQIAWDYSSVVQRHYGLVAALAPGLGLTSDQVDDLFRTAGAL